MPSFGWPFWPLACGDRLITTALLPTHRTCTILAQHMPMGSGDQYLGGYEKPFWRERGLMVILQSDHRPRVYFRRFHVRQEGRPGLLSGFDGSFHNSWRGRGVRIEERKKIVVESLISFPSSDRRRRTRSTTHDQAWPADPWSRGATSFPLRLAHDYRRQGDSRGAPRRNPWAGRRDLDEMYGLD